ncbi:MAG: TonB-dependent receptor, partial [Desulfobacterales bacterium]|nr:TonB-dependent receptor [Desulfobacterales bacterium]
RKASATMDLKKVSALIPKVHLDAFTQKTQKDFEQNMKINMGMMGTVNQDIKTFNDQQTSGTNLQIDITPNSRHYLIAGYSFTHDDLEADSSVKMPPMVNKVYTDETTIDTHALFVQDEWKLPQDLMLTLGARQTWVESELEESNRTGANEGSVNDNEPVFSGGITWNGVENLTLRGHFAQGYRFPDLSKLFIGTSHGGSTTNANPDLKPETSNNYELGARYNNGFWNIDFTAFYNDAEDYITRKATGSNVYQFTNVSKAETKGVELALKYKIDALKLTPYFSGTWMEREFKSPKRTTKKTGTPKFSGRLGIKYETPLTRWPALVWTDFWLRAASDSDSYDTSDKLIAKESWETLNFSMGAEFGTKGQYQVSLNLNNILDESYKTARNTLEEPGFHAVARLGVKF